MRVNMVNEIRELIIGMPELADSDVDLIWHIWSNQVFNMPRKKTGDRWTIVEISAIELMRWWKRGEISSPSNITRSRRKCQELYPETRGEAYESRQANQERVIRDVREAANIPDRTTQEVFSYSK